MLSSVSADAPPPTANVCIFSDPCAALFHSAAITQLPAFSLCIASWRRIAPLTCFFSRRLHRLSWTLKADSVGFRIDLPYTSIDSLAFSGPVRPSMAEQAEGISEPLGMLRVDLEKQPQFYMETFRSADPVDEADALQNRWRQTEDFTEGNAGTRCLTHVLSGPYDQLKEAVLALKGSDAAIAEKLVVYDAMPGATGEVSGSVPPPLPMPRHSTDVAGPPPLLRQHDWQQSPHQPSFGANSYGFPHGGAGAFVNSSTDPSPVTAPYELSFQHAGQHGMSFPYDQAAAGQERTTFWPATSDSSASLVGDETFSSTHGHLGHANARYPHPQHQHQYYVPQAELYGGEGPQQQLPPATAATLASLWSTDPPITSAPLNVGGLLINSSNDIFSGPQHDEGVAALSAQSSRRPSTMSATGSGSGTMHNTAGGDASPHSASASASASSLNSALAFGEPGSVRPSTASGAMGVWDRPPPMTLLAQRQASIGQQQAASGSMEQDSMLPSSL